MKPRLSGGTWMGLTVMILGAALVVAQVSGPARAAAPSPPLPSPAVPGATTTTLLPAPTGPAVSASTVPRAPGGASASAAVLGVSPQVSNLTLAVTFGQSLAAYLQTEAQASSSTINLGGLGALLANTPACGTTVIKPNQLPTPLSTDSTGGSSHKTTGATFGEEAVEASPSPESATASTKVVDLSVPGLLSVTATTTSAVHYVADAYQEADATVTETVDVLNGMVHLAGLTWTSKQQVGRAHTSASSFALGPVTINLGGLIPVPVPPSTSLATVFQLINTVTGTVGLTLTAPKVIGGPAPDTTTVSPLELRFSGTPLDNSIVSPANGPITELEQFLATNGNLGNGGCNLGATFYSLDTGVNVVLGALEGSGGVNIDLGGATAQTQASGNYSNPFGGPSPLPALPVTAPASSVVSLDAPPTAAPSPIAAGAPEATAPPDSAPIAPTAATAPAVCKTTSPAGVPGCWGGAGPIAAGAMAVLGAGLVAAELRRGRGLRRSGLRRIDQ